jgi:hypothetical protein
MCARLKIGHSVSSRRLGSISDECVKYVTGMSNEASLPGTQPLLPGGSGERYTYITGFERTSTANYRGYGTVIKYCVTTADGMEREIIHGRALARRRSPTESAHLTVGTAPALSLGAEGIVTHFLLKSMESGLDGMVFGPERSGRRAANEAEIRAIANGITFRSSAQVAHQICDRIGDQSSTDLSTMLWAGVSLGAMKGIVFASLAPAHARTMVYSQFVVPAAPNPMPMPQADELRRFARSEFGAMIRMGRELIVHDTFDRLVRLDQNLVRPMRRGLTYRYARSMPRDKVSRIFTEAWRAAVVTGDAGAAAMTLPADRLATFELFDRDEASSVPDWRDKLAGVLGDSVRVIVKHGKHSDALRLSCQQARARRIGRIIRAVKAGTPIDELTHPYG